MSYDNRVAEISSFPIEVLDEVVREGEAMLAAQLTVATAADQRAMTFAGLLIAAATAATGGVIALMLGDKPAWWVVLIGTLYAAAAIAAAGFAIWSAKPARFSFPGNEPALWHPDLWQVGASGPHSKKQARVEQAVNLQSQIKKNKVILARNARWMRRAVIVGFVATAIAAFATGIWGGGQWRDSLKAQKSASSAVKPEMATNQIYYDYHTVNNVQPKTDSKSSTPQVGSCIVKPKKSSTLNLKRAAKTVHSRGARVCKPSRLTTAE